MTYRYVSVKGRVITCIHVEFDLKENPMSNIVLPYTELRFILTNKLSLFIKYCLQKEKVTRRDSLISGAL